MDAGFYLDINTASNVSAFGILLQLHWISAVSVCHKNDLSFSDSMNCGIDVKCILCCELMT